MAHEPQKKDAKSEFDPTDTTRKIDFSTPVDLKQICGKNVLITGGANGLGASMTRRFCVQGAHVTIADIQVEKGEELVSELRRHGHSATFIKTDVTDWSSQVNAFKTAVRQSEAQSLDLVIACAGTPGIPLPLHQNVSLDEDPPAPSTITIDVTLTGVYYTAVLALHYFQLKSPNGPSPSRKHLLFIGSLASYLEVPPIADYTASKFGVRGLWKSIRREVRELGIRTNLIAPTFMPTYHISSSASKALEDKGAVIGKVEDVAEAAIRLECENDVDGRAVAVGGHGLFDLRDDPEGLDGGLEVLDYFKSGGFGGGMHTFKEVLGGRTF